MIDLRDLVTLRWLPPGSGRALAVHTARAAPLFDGILESDPEGTDLASQPLTDLAAADRLARATNEEIISIAIASAGHLRKIPVEDTFRALALKPLGTYRIHFAAIRILELCSSAALPFTRADTHLLCSIALNTPRRDDVSEIVVQKGREWPEDAARLLTSRIVAAERLDLIDLAVAAAEVLDGGMFDGPLATQIVRIRQRLDRIKNPGYEVNELKARVAEVLDKPTDLIAARFV